LRKLGFTSYKYELKKKETLQVFHEIFKLLTLLLEPHPGFFFYTFNSPHIACGAINIRST